METTAERRERIGAAFETLNAQLPLEHGEITLGIISWQAPFLFLIGTGGGIDWPVRIVDAPDRADLDTVRSMLDRARAVP